MIRSMLEAAQRPMLKAKICHKSGVSKRARSANSHPYPTEAHASLKSGGPAAKPHISRRAFLRAYNLKTISLRRRHLILIGSTRRVAYG
jgi:hypothetical protein